MWDHVGIHVSDRDASRRFYDLVLGVLGHELTHPGEHFDEWNDFGIDQAGGDRPVTRNVHVAFVARSRADVDAFWRAGVDAGYPSDGEPGERPQYADTYYGAFLLDPDGNSAEAIHHEEPRPGDNYIDHMWIGVSDLEAAKHFYETVAPIVGVRIAHTRPEPSTSSAKAAPSRSCTTVVRPPKTCTSRSASPDNATVDEFHRVALAAGLREQRAAR